MIIIITDLLQCLGDFTITRKQLMPINTRMVWRQWSWSYGSFSLLVTKYIMTPSHCIMRSINHKKHVIVKKGMAGLRDFYENLSAPSIKPIQLQNHWSMKYRSNSCWNVLAQTSTYARCKEQVTVKSAWLD